MVKSLIAAIGVALMMTGSVFAATTVTTEAELKAAVAAGGEITLGADIQLSEALNATADISLDLSGYTLTAGSDGMAINSENGKSVTIKDSGKNGEIKGIINNGNPSTIIIEGGIYTSLDKYVFWNTGTMTINGGVVNGKGSYPLYSYNAGHKLTINDVIVNGECGCLNAYGKGEVIVNGGTFNYAGREGYTYHIVYVSNDTKMTINGGSFQKVGEVDLSAEGGGGICGAGTSELIINGGSFSGAYTDVTDYSASNVITINGGTFKNLFGGVDAVKDDCLAVGAIITNRGTTYTKTEGGLSEISGVARIGAQGYATLEEAIAAAQEGETITLLKDISVSDSILIDKSLVLDLNSKIITSSHNRSIKINTNGNAAKTVIIKNGTVISTPDAGRCIQLMGDALERLELNGVTFKAEKGQSSQTITLAETNSTKPLEFVVKNSTVVASNNNGYACIFFCPIDATIENSTISGYAALYFKNAGVANTSEGSVVDVIDSNLIGTNVQGGKNTFGTITTEANNVTINVSGGSITANKTNDALQTIVYCGWYAGKSTGLVASLNTELLLGDGCRILDVNEDISAQTVAVRAEYADEVAAEDFSVGSANENGLVSIVAPVAKIGETKYTSLAEALAAAQAGDTITLLGNCELVSGIDIDKNITVDGAGYKVYAANNANKTEMFNIRSKVTITNLTFDANHKFSYGIQVQDAADVTLSDVSILYAGYNNWGAAVNLNGGKLFVSGNFTAFSGGENGGAFPFTGILYWGGDFKFADGVTASIADPTGATADSDLLLVGTVGLLSIKDADAFLSQFNIPSGFAPYTLALDADIVSSFGGFTGASPLPWNTIIDYGKQILEAIGESTTETQVTVGLLDDTVIPEVFVYEDANFSINGNGKTLTGTIDVTDNVGTISNVVLTSGTTFVMTNVTTGCVKFGDNVTVSSPVTIVPPANYGVGSAPLIEFTDGSGVKPEDFVIDQSAVEIPEGTEFVVEGNKIVLGTPVAKIGEVKYASLLGAIAAAKSGDTVTLLGDCGITTGIILNKNITIDGGNFTLTAESGDGSLAQMVRVDSAATIKNITLAVNHKYDYGIQMNNPASDLTLENVTILYAGKAEGHKNGELLFGASVFLQQGNLLVKGKFTAFSGGETAGTFPFTGILYWPAGDTAPTFRFDTGATASISDPTGATSDSDLLLVGAPGILSVDEADLMLSAFNIPAGFAPYTLKLDCSIVQGVGGGFTGASPLAWNTIIDYGKKILTVVNESTTETQVEVGILDDVEIPEVFVYEDANFSINGNGKELKGTIDFTDNVGTIKNVELTSDMTFVMTNVTEGCVKLGEGVIITEPVKVIPPDNFGRGEDSATLIEFAEGSGLSLEDFEIDTSTVQLPEGSQIVQDGNKIIVKLPIAQVGNRKFATLTEAFEAANDGDTVRVLYSFNTNETIVINKAITFDFSGDVITNTASGAAIQVEAEGVKFIGGELVAKGNGIEVANGGSSVIERGVYEVTGDALAGAVTVSGGTFNKEASVINVFKSDDCEAVDNDDGWCTVMDYVAQFGDEKYVSLQVAIDAAAASNPTVDNPARVTLLGNVAGSVTLPENVIINANGYTVQSVVDSNGYIVELHGGAYQVGKYPEPPPVRSIKIEGNTVKLSFVPRQILKTVVVEASSDLKTWMAMDGVTYVDDGPGKECVISVEKPQGNNAFFRVKFEYAD